MPATIKSWLSHLGCLTIGWTFAHFIIETRQPDIVDSREAGYDRHKCPPSEFKASPAPPSARH